MSKKLKKRIYRIIASLIVFIIALVLKDSIVQLPLFLIAYGIIGYDVVSKAIKNIGHGQLFDENFLMTLATVAAFVTQEYPEAVMVMWLYQVGEVFQSYAVNKSRTSIASLSEIRADTAIVIGEDGDHEEDVELVEIGQLIRVRPGDRIPLDGIVVQGSSYIDNSALTGESRLVKVDVDQTVLSGGINKEGTLVVKVTSEASESTVARILEMVENASERKAKTEAFVTRFARYYTPVVVIVALLLAIVPPLFFNKDWIDYIHRACSFLVISCPCALVISVPLGYFGGIGAASKQGILVKGSNYLEALSKVDTMVFDKTGTLTQGKFTIQSINSLSDISQQNLLAIAKEGEKYSTHPIAQVFNDYKSNVDIASASSHQEISGQGVIYTIEDSEYAIGNARLMKSKGIDIPLINSTATIIYLCNNSKLLGYFEIADSLKPSTKDALASLRQDYGIKQQIMLSGDQQDIADDIGKQCGLDYVVAQLLPTDKLDALDNIMAKDNHKGVAYIGDGINDAPVLKRADVGIAMGALGSDAAIEAADIVIMDDDLSRLTKAIDVSKKTQRIVMQNIVFSLAIKFGVLLLGLIGVATMWEAVFADVGVAFIAICNSMRILNVKN